MTPKSMLATALGLACLLAPLAARQAGVGLTGAGSTFINPAMQRWAADFKKSRPGGGINYQSVGSGAGIQQVKNNTVDFGASDAVINDQALAAMPPVLQIPESAGPVCITYNLPELKQPLRLTANALAGIFLGSVASWNDPAIAGANPGVHLPDTAVLVAHRSDGSGTSAIFTAYLSAVSGDWKAKVGAGSSVNWPVGLGGKGSEGVTGVVKQTAGAIGYVELTYASANRLPVAWVQNAAGKFVAPSAPATSAAIDAFRADLARDPRAPIVNAPSPAAYPIAGLTYLIIAKDGPDPAKRASLKAFVDYILGPGQATAAALGYAPLPASMLALDRRLLDGMTAAGKPIR